MTVTEIGGIVREPAHYMEALAYRAPFLIEKLMKEQIVETPEEGEALFSEVIKYFILCRCYPAKQWELMSRRIDEVWHQFVLFTPEYTAFCKRYFDRYLHHFPGNSPSTPAKPTDTAHVAISPVVDFRNHYENLFGTFPDIWFDRTSIAPGRRVLIDRLANRLVLAPDPGSDMVTLQWEKGVILSVNSIARAALEFIVRTRAFYVRELPGDLTDEEKVAIVETLVAQRVLLVGA
jgi:hypothetical protein